MAAIDYRETELWRQAKALLIEAYRLTSGWPTEGQELAKDIRGQVRTIVKAVPNAFKKGGIAGNVHLRISHSHFGELEALCEAAEALGFVEAGTLQPITALAGPMSEEFKKLARAAQENARELMVKRTGMFGQFDEDDVE